MVKDQDFRLEEWIDIGIEASQLRLKVDKKTGQDQKRFRDYQELISASMEITIEGVTSACASANFAPNQVNG